MWYLIKIFIVASCFPHIRLAAYAECGVCTKYGIACISETDFHICVDRGNSGMIADKSVRYSCAEGEICTSLREVCVSRNSSVSTAVPTCTDNCDVCEYGKSFACTSRTTFALCKGHEITSVVGTCPGSLICDIEGPGICIEKCVQHNITCDREFPSSTLRPLPLPVNTPLPTRPPVVTPTPTPNTTPTANPIGIGMPTPTPIPEAAQTPKNTPTSPSMTQTPWEVCAAKKMAGRFPYDNESSCTKYVYCRFRGSVLVAVPNTCAIDTYFNQGTQLCDTIKPNWCI